MAKKYNSLKDKMIDSVNVAILAVFLLICAYPFYYVFIYSISDPNKVQSGVYIIPAGFSLEVYKNIFQLENMLNAFAVSLLRTLAGTLLTLFCCSLLAFLITQKDYSIRKFIYRFLVITMYFNAGLIPWYLTIKYIGLKDSFLVYILPSALSAFYVVLIKTYMEQLPKALEESAMLDGAGFFTIYRKIILPMSMPIIATIAVFAAVGQWNSWIDTYFFIQTKSLYTAQYVLYSFLKEAENIAETMRMNNNVRSNSSVVITPASIKMGITMIVTIPVILIYPFMQKYFVKGIMLGAIKG